LSVLFTGCCWLLLLLLLLCRSVCCVRWSTCGVLVPGGDSCQNRRVQTSSACRGWLLSGALCRQCADRHCGAGHIACLVGSDHAGRRFSGKAFSSKHASPLQLQPARLTDQGSISLEVHSALVCAAWLARTANSPAR
jgi:hypothetical protein